MNLTADLFNSYISTIRESYYARIEHIGALAIAISRDDLVQDMKTLWPHCNLSDNNYFELIVAVYFCMAQTEHAPNQTVLEQSLDTLAKAYYSDHQISLEFRHAQAILSKYKLRSQDHIIVDCLPEDTFSSGNCILQKIHTKRNVLFNMYMDAPVCTAYSMPETTIGPLGEVPHILYDLVKNMGVFEITSIFENSGKVQNASSYIDIYSKSDELYQLIEWLYDSKQLAMTALLHAWLSRNENYDIEECLLKASDYEKETWTGIFEHFLCNHSNIRNISDINKCIKLQHEFGVELKDIVIQMCLPETIGINTDIEFSC